MNRPFLGSDHATSCIDHMEMKDNSDFMNDVKKMIEEWLASSKAWFELESARLRLEAETMVWEAENNVFSLEAGCYDWEFIDEWL